MNRTLLMLVILSAGIAQPIQGAVNAHLAQRGATVLWAAAISAGITSVTLAVLAVFVFEIPAPSLKLLWSMPFVTLAGGIIGVLLLGSITAVTPRLGATATYLCFVAGIAICSVMLDHFGVLGLQQQEISVPRLLGVAMIVGGVVVIRVL